MEDHIPIRPDRSLLLVRQTSKWSLWDVVFHENNSNSIVGSFYTEGEHRARLVIFCGGDSLLLRMYHETFNFNCLSLKSSTFGKSLLGYPTVECESILTTRWQKKNVTIFPQGVLV